MPHMVSVWIRLVGAPNSLLFLDEVLLILDGKAWLFEIGQYRSYNKKYIYIHYIYIHIMIIYIHLLQYILELYLCNGLEMF